MPNQSNFKKQSSLCERNQNIQWYSNNVHTGDKVTAHRNEHSRHNGPIFSPRLPCSLLRSHFVFSDDARRVSVHPAARAAGRFLEPRHAKMSRNLSILIFILNFILFCEGKTIPNEDLRSDVVKSDARIENRYTNENIALRRLRRSEKTTNYYDNYMVNCVDENSIGKNKCASKNMNKESRLMLALSKVAKITMGPTDSGLRSENTFFNSVTEDARNSKTKERFEGERNEGDYSQNSSDEPMKSSNVHCQATEDVYITEVKQSLPAFVCKFGRNTFVLSSERFLQDKRSQLDIRIDENAFRNIKVHPKLSRSYELNTVPAMLVLSHDNGYRIEINDNVPKEKSVERKEIDKKLSNEQWYL